MAFAAMNITVGGAAALGSGPLPTLASWSQSMASVGVATLPVPNGGKALVRFYATADSWVAFGPTAAIAQTRAADGSVGPRWPVPALLLNDLLADSGDFIAWMPA